MPDESIQDKIHFIFNNLSAQNMDQKERELNSFLRTEHHAFLGQYLVVKRASIEPNFHTLYSSFLEVMTSDQLYDKVVKETYKNIAILLRADKSIANFSDRSLLKNLGHWLGLMLLARNKPILMVDLDMKHLIIEAYHNGQQEKQQELLYVVPFVAKVLESTAKSKVFKPPCPWTMGLMNLLAELHTEPDLKLNLKFEIEVLCKTLSVEIAELRPGNALKDYQRLGKLLSFQGFGINTAPSNQLTNLKPPMETLKKVDFMPENTFNSSSFGPSLTQAPSNFSPAAGAFSQPPGAAGVGMGSVMMATPQAQATMTAQTAQLNEQPVTSKPEPSLVPTNTPVVARPLEPKFHFLEINTSNLSGLVPHISVDGRLPLLKEHPEFTQLIKLAIEKSVQEWISPVIERAIKIAITTCEQIVKKDFSLDYDETRMRVAAHHMVRNLTAGMAMITCRDHLLLSIKNNLKNIMMTLGRANMQPDQVSAIDVTVSVIANDNVELACAFIQKKAVEKAIPEIDKRLNVEIELRKMARKEGRRYCDPVALTYQSERMPDQIRLRVGQAPAAQAAVFDEFARNIPGFKPLTLMEAQQSTHKPGGPADPNSGPPAVANASLTASDDCVAILDEVHSKLQPFIEQCTGLPPTPHMAALTQLLESLHMARTSKEVASVIVLIGRAVESLLEGLTPGLQTEPDMLARYRDANILVLRALADQRAYGPNWTGRQVTVALVDSREEVKWNIDAVDALIRSNLVNLFEYDKYLANAMENGHNGSVINFAMMLVKIYLIDDRSNAHIIESDLFGTIEVLSKIANHSRSPPDGLVQLVDMIKMSSERIEHNLAMSGPTAQLHSGIQQAREFEDPPGLLEKTEFLLRDWVNMYHSPSAGKDSTKAFTIFVQQMNLHGLLKTDDLITRFFRMSTQMCVDLCYRALAEQNNNPTLVRAKCFHTLDAFVRLIALLVKHSGDQQNTITKVNLLNKVLGIVAGVLLIDHDVRGVEFQQVPYHRIFIMLFLELNAPDQILETINFQVIFGLYYTTFTDD
jgi:CCR4-NOT transcription complex subunit 1